MGLPSRLQVTTARETYAGVTYQIEGELVPVLHLGLDQMPVYFEHHILLWKDPRIQIGVKSLKGAFKRVLSGMPIFMTEAYGPGHLAFSRDGVGQVFPLHLRPGEAIDVREHQFLAATANLEYTFNWVKGTSNILFGGSGLFIDTFYNPQQQAILWLHGYGNVFEVILQPGEQLDIEPGGWIYKDRTVQMETQFQKLATGLFASGGQLFWNRFTGPGRVGIQSMYYHPIGSTGEQSGGGGLNIRVG